MVCVPCLIIPAVMILAQLLYKIPFLRALVQRCFPHLRLAEEKAAREAEEESRKKQAEFWAKDAKALDRAEEGEEATNGKAGGEEGAKQRTGNGSSSKKKKGAVAEAEAEPKKQQ
jgi:hypothetical protein